MKWLSLAFEVLILLLLATGLVLLWLGIFGTILAECTQ